MESTVFLLILRLWIINNRNVIQWKYNLNSKKRSLSRMFWLIALFLLLISYFLCTNNEKTKKKQSLIAFLVFPKTVVCTFGICTVFSFRLTWLAVTCTWRLKNHILYFWSRSSLSKFSLIDLKMINYRSIKNMYISRTYFFSGTYF